MSAASPSTPEHDSSGILYATASYVIWGVLPLYWHVLGSVPPFELSMHRMVWCALFGLAVTAGFGRLGHIKAALRQRRVLVALCASSILIAINWTVYIVAVAHHQLVEASRGHDIKPPFSIALGVLFLGERHPALRVAAMVLASVAVAVKVIGLGYFPWIALSLAVSFALYGYVRKQTPVAAFDGLTIETLLLLPITGSSLLYWGFSGTGAFLTGQTWRDVLLVVGGPLTALPLALFAAGARRIRLSTLGFLQYLSPTITLIIAITLLGEGFSRGDATTFGCVWLALVLVALDGRMGRTPKAANSAAASLKMDGEAPN